MESSDRSDKLFFQSVIVSDVLLGTGGGQQVPRFGGNDKTSWGTSSER